MKLVLTVIAACFVCGCATTRSVPQADWQPQGLPSPSTLSRNAPAPAHAASGVYTSFERTLSSEGFRYSPFPGYSANAEAIDNYAVIHGSTATLNYALYQVNSQRFSATDRLTEVQLDFQWPAGEPTAPLGVYIGLPDQDNDRWVWQEARDLNGQWADVSAFNLRGLDPVAYPGGGFFAVVNHSNVDVEITRLLLRYKPDAVVDGDEFIYYMSAVLGDPGGATSVSRVALAGGAPELIHATDITTVTYGLPVVVDYHGAWQLTYSRRSTSGRIEVWMSDMDGAAPWAIAESATVDLLSAGWDYGTDRGFFTRSNGTNLNLYAFHDTLENGRLSRSFDHIGKSVWDVSNDISLTAYSAVASRRYDDVNELYGIVRIQGSPPFPIDAGPLSLTTLLPDEDQWDPAMVQLDKLNGNPAYYVYFSSRNRDDTSYNIYKMEWLFSPVVPVLVDAAHNLRFPTPSLDGRYLAYFRLPAGSSAGDLGELVVTDLLNPQSGEQILATDCVGQLSWYDPTP